MTAIGRSQFNSLAEDLSTAYRFIAELPNDEPASEELAIENLYDELSIRQHVCSYTDAFDSKDLDRIISHFADDGVLTTNRGVWAGRAEVRAYYAPTTLQNRLSYHRVQDFLIRVTNPSEEALVAAFFHAPFVGASDAARAQFGRYFGRIEKHAGSWKFADWRISVDANWIFPAFE